MSSENVEIKKPQPYLNIWKATHCAFGFAILGAANDCVENVQS
jgi:hypothetical protein